MEAADPGGSTRRKRRAVAWGAVAGVVVFVAGFAYLYKPPPAATLTAASPTTKPGEATDDVVFYEFSSPLVAWALQYPTRSPQTTEGRFWISRTVDGGRHWQVRFKGRRSFGGYSPALLRFFDSDHGLVYLGDSQTQLLRTSDGGASWQSVSTFPSVRDPQATEVAINDAGHIWLLDRFIAGEPHLYVTADAGHIWQQLPDPPANTGSLMLRRSSEAWLSWNGPGPRVYRSTDGGLSWKARDVPYPPVELDAAGQPWRAFVRLLPDKGAIAVEYCSCGIDRTFAFMSLDGGATWRPVSNPPGVLAYADDIHWWAVKGKVLYQSSDAGQTWISAPAQLPDWQWQLNPTTVDRQHAWARIMLSGGGFGLATTSDAGLHWTRVKVPQST